MLSTPVNETEPAAKSKDVTESHNKEGGGARPDEPPTKSSVGRDVRNSEDGEMADRVVKATTFSKINVIDSAGEDNDDMADDDGDREEVEVEEEEKDATPAKSKKRRANAASEEDDEDGDEEEEEEEGATPAKSKKRRSKVASEDDDDSAEEEEEDDGDAAHPVAATSDIEQDGDDGADEDDGEQVDVDELQKTAAWFVINMKMPMDKALEKAKDFMRSTKRPSESSTPKSRLSDQKKNKKKRSGGRRDEEEEEGEGDDESNSEGEGNQNETTERVVFGKQTYELFPLNAKSVKPTRTHVIRIQDVDRIYQVPSNLFKPNLGDHPIARGTEWPSVAEADAVVKLRGYTKQHTVAPGITKLVRTGYFEKDWRSWCAILDVNRDTMLYNKLRDGTTYSFRWDIRSIEQASRSTQYTRGFVFIGYTFKKDDLVAVISIESDTRVESYIKLWNVSTGELVFRRIKKCMQ